MLARLEVEPSVETAQVDRRGELLRVAVRSGADVQELVGRLFEMGFASEIASDVIAGSERWYGVGEVGELSREEANVIAGRVVPPFAQQNGVAASDVGSLAQLVASALHACFISQTLDIDDRHGLLNTECGRAVETATSSRLGHDRATALGRSVEADLASRSAFKE